MAIKQKLKNILLPLMIYNQEDKQFITADIRGHLISLEFLFGRCFIQAGYIICFALANCLNLIQLGKQSFKKT